MLCKYYLFLFLCSSCINKHNPQFNNQLLPAPEIYYDKDHDDIPDGIDPSPLLADIPELKIFEFESKLKANGIDLNVVKSYPTQVHWGFKLNTIVQYLRSHQQHPENLIPTKIRPQVQIDLSHNLRFWSELAEKYSQELVTENIELQWLAQIGVQGLIFDKYIFNETSWNFLDEQKNTLGRIHKTLLSLVFQQTDKHFISAANLIRNGEKSKALTPRYIKIEFDKIKMYRNGKITDINTYFEQLFKNNVSVWVITNQNQILYSFAPGLTMEQMFQTIDPLFVWQEEGRELRNFLSLRQEIDSWDSYSNMQNLSDTLGRWDIIVNPELNHESKITAGKHILLVYTTVQDQLLEFIQDRPISQNISSANNKINLGHVESGQKKLWQLKGKLELPEYSIVENFVVPAIVDIEISGELGNRGRKSPLQGSCGIRYRHFKKWQNKELDSKDVASFRPMINGHVLDSKDLYFQPVQEKGQFWLAINSPLTGKLELEWSLDRYTQPSHLGFLDYGDCGHRFKGDNFRFAENIQVGPWPNENLAKLTLELIE